MGSSKFLFVLLCILAISRISAKYEDLEAHGKESKDIARKILKAFAEQQDIEDDRLELLDVLEAKQQNVYTPNDSYRLGELYKQRLAVGVSECSDNNLCPVNQGLLLEATLLSLVNQPSSYAFNVLGKQL